MKYPTLEELVMGSELGPRIIERGRVQGLEQGREQGLEKGLEQGREQGREQGLEKGKEIIARNLLGMGMSIEEIAQAVELPVEKIRTLAAAA